MSWHKYNAKPTQVDGIRFDSKMESRRYQELQLMVQAGEIERLELQPVFELQPKFTDRRGVKHTAIKYRADFRYWDVRRGCEVIEDVKGHHTYEFQIKEKLFRYKFPELNLEIVE